MNIAIFNSARIGLEIKKMYEEMKRYYPFNIKLIERMFSRAVSVAKQLETQDSIDAIITGGATYEQLCKEVNIPVVSFSITGFDLLKAIMSAKWDSAQKVAIVNYKQSYPDLKTIQQLLNIDLFEFIYNDFYELTAIVKKIKHEGITFVVGTTIICDLAEKYGMRTYIVYSREAIRNAMKTAYDMVISRRKEIERTEQLKAILDFAYSGIVAINEKGIVTMFNPAAQKITGIDPNYALGKPIEQVIPKIHLSQVFNSKTLEIDQIENVNSVDILINRVPIVVQGEIRGVVATCQDINSLQQTEAKVRRKLHKKGLSAKNTFDDIIGQSLSIKKTISKAKSYANSQSTILIYGETGTGKELFAQSIHNYSKRRNQPFVAVNCAALPEMLLESELFGYEEGAFTGARKGGKPGLFELAHLGTIFLDEISEIPLNIQARLLRVLQEKEIMRIGSDKLQIVDIRIITATNQDLWGKVQNGSFREDLYYRLNVLKLNLPPLRDRIDDIPSLVMSLKLPKTLESYLPLIMKKFKNLYWPGNIRQLKNAIEKLVALSDEYTENINLYEFTKILDEVAENIPPLNSYSRGTTEIRSEMNNTLQPKLSYGYTKIISDDTILRALSEVKGNKVKAARKLGISRMTLWRRLKKLDI